MTLPKPTSAPAPVDPDGQREALAESQREASRERPQNFKQEQAEAKVVEVLPIDGDGAAIKGLDPAK